MTGRTDTTGPGAMARITETEAGNPAQAAVRRLDAGALLAGGRECIIVHRDSEYRLRVTSNGKLILTK